MNYERLSTVGVEVKIVNETNSPHEERRALRTAD